MKHIVKIIHIHQVTHDVKCFRFEKPEGYYYLPGHAADVCSEFRWCKGLDFANNTCISRKKSRRLIQKTVNRQPSTVNQ